MASVTATSSTFTFSAAAFQRLHPAEYFRKFVSQGVRPDGRLLSGFRPTTVHKSVVSTANGSSMVRVGGTTVVCGIKAEVAEPKLEAQDEGFIVPNVELSPMCSSAFKPGPPSEQAQVVSDAIDRILKDSDVVDLKQLCIEKGRAVWTLWADVVCISYDGNILDAALLAIMAALTNVRLRKPTYDDGIVSVSGEALTEENSFSLTLTRTPLSTTFAIFDSPNSTLLADPNSAEENVSLGRITVTLDEKNQLCGVHKVGAGPSSPSIIKSCIARATERSQELRALLA
ncbi:Exosome complex component RRP43 [Actinomortierella ambigua]|nr:Exosome complex component RRP43 [Actinomortierella ambigua]